MINSHTRKQSELSITSVCNTLQAESLSHLLMSPVTKFRPPFKKSSFSFFPFFFILNHFNTIYNDNLTRLTKWQRTNRRRSRGLASQSQREFLLCIEIIRGRIICDGWCTTTPSYKNKCILNELFSEIHTSYFCRKRILLIYIKNKF